tara:strand:+ start:434 stop:913 length:480 start_codon:yes stop_codon:yes gene_type:complete
MGMQLIEHIEVGSGGAASIEFTGIPQDSTDIEIVFSLRSGNGDGGLRHYFNGDTGNRTTIQLRGSGSTVSSSPQNQIQGTNKSTTTASTFSSGKTYVSNYTSSTAKSFSVDVVTENNATDASMEIAASKWNSTAAINSMTLLCDGGFVEHSTASIYLIS